MKFDFKSNRPAFLRPLLESHDAEKGTGIPRVCRMCPTKLTSHVLYYCSGFCLSQAKAAGVYGKENV